MSESNQIEDGIYEYCGEPIPCAPQRFRIPVFHRAEDNDPTGLIKAQRRLDSELDSNWAGRILQHTHRKDKWVGVSLSRLWTDHQAEIDDSMNLIEKYILFGWILLPWFKRKEMVNALRSLEEAGFLTRTVFSEEKREEIVYFPTPKLLTQLIGERKE